MQEEFFRLLAQPCRDDPLRIANGNGGSSHNLGVIKRRFLTKKIYMCDAYGIGNLLAALGYKRAIPAYQFNIIVSRFYNLRDCFLYE